MGIVYWASGHITVLIKDGQGNTVREVNVVTAPEQASSMDWRSDGAMELEYSDGTNILSKVSTDNGASWA